MCIHEGRGLGRGRGREGMSALGWMFCRGVVSAHAAVCGAQLLETDTHLTVDEQRFANDADSVGGQVIWPVHACKK